MGKTDKKPRKLSAYNKFVKKHRLAGKSMKQIGRMWKGTGSNPKPKSGGSKNKSKSSSKTGGRKVGKPTFNTNKIFGLVRKAALIAPFAGVALRSDLTPQAKVRVGVAYATGYNIDTGQWSFEDLKRGYFPYIATVVMTTLAQKVGSFVRGILG